MQRLLVVAMLVVLVIAALLLGPDALRVVGDLSTLRETVLGLGAWGPLALIALNVVQIVLAPVPAYAMQLAGGYLYGAWWGTLYGIVGMLGGAAVAFLLVRRFGVRVLERFMPPRLLNGWLHLRNLNSLTAWLVVLLLPVGDFCYFLAGLTAMSLPRMLFLTLLVRGPTVFLTTYAGAQVTSVPPQILWGLVVALVVLGAIIVWQRDNIEMLVLDRLAVRIFGKRDEQDGKQD
jgi:uncharacterized membrane protein YdjX (TVP38/TMEM64 family)